MEEIFLFVPMTADRFRVSNYGKVERLVDGDWLPVTVTINQSPRNKTGYFVCSITFIYGSLPISVHRLIASLFLPYDPIRRIVNHKDFDTLNNKVDNLEYVTQSENCQYSSKNMGYAKQGEKHPTASISDDIAIQIKRDRKSGMRYKKICEKYNIPMHTALNVCTRYYSHLNDKV